MRLDVLREIPDDSSLRADWNALALRMEHPQVFYTYEWALAVYRSYRSVGNTLLFLAYDDLNALCGVAALRLDPASRTICFLTANTGDYCDFLSAAERRAEFVSAALSELKKMGVRSLVFTNLPADSATVAAISGGARNHGLRCHMRTAYRCAQVQLQSKQAGPAPDPVPSHKKILRRFVNAMGRENPVRLEHRRTWEAIEPVLPEFRRAHVARFLVTGRISNLARPERHVFLTELAKLLSESGWVALTRMVSGDRVFAWNYGFLFQGTWFWYQPTFDSDVEKYSPGFCLLAKIVEEASGNPAVNVVDLGLGAEDYKDRFANQIRETLYVSLQNSALRHCREIVRDQAAAWVKARPPLERAIRSAILIGRGWPRGLPWQNVLSLSRRRFRDWWLGCECFCSGNQSVCGEIEGVQLCAMDLNHLAAAAMEYVDDEDTLSYLLRATRRLRSKQAEGFVLADAKGMPLHFVWQAPVYTSLAKNYRAPAGVFNGQDTVLLDAWTPGALRGRGHCVQALRLIAKDASIRSRRVWAYSSSGQELWERALLEAGFWKRFSLRRNSIFQRRPKTSTSTPSDEISAQGVSARV